MHLSFYFPLLILALLFLTISAVGSPINIWPKPRIFSWTSPQAIPISGAFQIKCPPHEQLTSAAARYLWRILAERHKPLVNPTVNLTASNPLLRLSISVSDLTATLSNGVNESYTLSTPSDNSTVAYLTAETPWGAMRGLESFSQLVWGNPGYVAAGVWISDWPLFAHRGIMLDTSRNYFGVDDLLRTIKAMSDNKLNVFHWHITDSHSFPLVLPSEMDLAAKGSYGPEMVYTPEDVKKVVDFGMDHGVRVMPEIDMPGHTGSFANAYPEIVTCANEFWWPSGSSWSDRLAAEPGTGHLNPINPKTYEVLKNMIKDVTSMFPEEFYHAGADEIIPRCWESDPTVKSYMEENNVTLSQLLEKFVNTTYPYISSANKTVVYWEDVLLDSEISVDPSLIPSSNTILQTWNNGPNNTKRIAENGYRVIVSSSDFYYLDCGHGDFVGNNSEYNQPPGFNQTNGGSWCGPFKSWQLIYNYDINYGLTDVESELVLGGEVALWTEQADPTVLDARLWPRSSAFAEAMWSGNRDKNGSKRFAEATDRLNEWRYRMVKRGVSAEPIQPLWCIRNPGMCNTVQGLAS